MNDRDFSAIASWDANQDPRDAEPTGWRGDTYRCTDCNWTGKAAEAYDHHKASRHHRITVGGRLVHFGCCHELNAKDQL
jgi:hypothetical protein